MNQDRQNDSMFEYDELFTMTLSSIRDIGKRIDELKMGIFEKWYNDKGIEEVKKRIIVLKNTKFNLMWTIYDIRQKILNNYAYVINCAEKEEMEEILKLGALYTHLKDL